MEAVEGDGGVTAVHDRTGRRVTLPAAYVGEAVELGYAVTKDRAQGLTVDSGHALFDSSMDRNGAYPALTRGRWANHAYLVTVKPGDPETGEPGERLTHRQVWQAVLRRDGTQQSATMTARRSEEAARWCARTRPGWLSFSTRSPMTGPVMRWLLFLAGRPLSSCSRRLPGPRCAPSWGSWPMTASTPTGCW